MGLGIREPTARTRDPHHIGNKSGRPRVVSVVTGRECHTVFVMNPGPALLRPARIETEPPILTDSLPEPLFPFLIFRQLDMGKHYLLPKRPPLAQRNLD